MNIQVAVVVLLGTLSWTYAAHVRLAKRQVGTAVIDSEDDHSVAESGYGGHPGKYFQYTHVPAKDHYEFGHKRGNDHHFIERHEKAHPHAGEFKTKVRWGDKHGGYGEHYWDYNHGGHDGSGEESNPEPEYVRYEETKQIPTYAVTRGKRQPKANPKDDVEFINDRVRSLVKSGLTGKHGGNYRRDPREKRQFEDKDFFGPSEVIVDQKTGIAYKLQPVVEY